jgi:hypothetical protein
MVHDFHFSRSDAKYLDRSMGSDVLIQPGVHKRSVKAMERPVGFIEKRVLFSRGCLTGRSRKVPFSERPLLK